MQSDGVLSEMLEKIEVVAKLWSWCIFMYGLCRLSEKNNKYSSQLLQYNSTDISN